MGDLATKARRESLCVLKLGLRQDDRKLLTADAASDFNSVNHLANAIGDTPQGGVACRVTELVVDLPEVVEVEQDKGERPSVSLRAFNLALKRFDEVAVVVEPGQ